MNQTIKQMMVMLFSVIFLCMVAIMVLSSSAAATTAAEIERDNMESVRDSNLDRAESVLSGNYYQKPNIHHAFSDERIPTQHTTPYFNDEPVVYDNHHEIERLEDEIETMRYELSTNDEYDTDFSDGLTERIIALIIILIIAFIIYSILCDINEKTSHTYKPDTSDTTDRIRLTIEEMNELDVYMDSDEYKQTSNKDMALNCKVDQMIANRSAQSEIEDEWE